MVGMKHKMVSRALVYQQNLLKPSESIVQTISKIKIIIKFFYHVGIENWRT